MVFLYKLLPNPAGKDTLGEFFIIKNLGDKDENITGWKITDYSGKEFIFQKNTTIKVGGQKSFKYSTTKISLNNNGDEIKLFDGSNILVDEIKYGSVKEGECVMHSGQFEKIESCFVDDSQIMKYKEITEENINMYANMNKIFPNVNRAFNTLDVALICLVFSLFLSSIFWYIFKKIRDEK